MDSSDNVPGKKRILIIEDEAAFRDVLSAELQKAGYAVISAQDGEEGIEKIRSTRPDLVLLDIIMPRKDGFTVLQEVALDSSLKSIPIVVLSNSGDMVELSRAKEMGVRDILVKTVFGPQELLARIEHILSDAQGEALSQPSQASDTYTLPDVSETIPSSANPATSDQQSKGHVLVVEDDPFLWSLIQAKLAKEGFKVTIAKDGQEALTLAKETKPSLILLDIILPDINGFDVLKQLKEDATTKPIPVIILSNLGQQEDISKGIALGAKDYLIKAHHAPQEIADKIKEILSQ